MLAAGGMDEEDEQGHWTPGQKRGRKVGGVSVQVHTLHTFSGLKWCRGERGLIVSIPHPHTHTAVRR